MKTLRILTALTLALLLFAGPAVTAQAAAPNTLDIRMTYINPLYRDILTEEDLITPSPSRADAVPCADPEYTTSVQEAGQIMREAMKKRQASVTVYFQHTANSVDEAMDIMQEKIMQISDTAMAHTGVPTEGDYIMWQFGGWEIPEDGATGYYEGNDFFWTLTFYITYYTTAAEEQQVDAAVEDILTELDVYNASDYKKVKAVYDYICENVTYDYDHLNDSSYKHQFTAYGGLIDGTCVCQGYAVIFYRLALELDVDARLIPGVSHGENHGWNIVELNDLYYHADSTWDAGMDEYSYFLKGKDFPDHTRDADYDSAAFHAEYPMDTNDYVYDPSADCDHSYTSKITTEADCLTDGIRTYTCTICGDSYTESIPATGHSWDDGIIQQAPTETEDGIRLYTCEACGETKTEVIPANAAVYRVSGENRYRTALRAADMLKETLGVAKFDTIVVACGTDFADALSGSYLACKKNAPILPVNKNTITTVAEYILANLDEDGMVYILGGEGAVPMTLDDALKAEEIQIQRLQGSSRYDTNLMILAEAGVTDDQPILICTGNDYADALSASATGLPILLVNKNIDKLRDDQKAFLEGLNGNKLYIIGGEGAVSENIEKEVKAYGACQRVQGSGRYETSVRIAETFFQAPTHAVLAYGHTFPDGLCGGPLAHTMGAPLILTRDTTSSHAIAYAEANGIRSGVVLGGNSLISDNTVKEIFQMADSGVILE